MDVRIYLPVADLSRLFAVGVAALFVALLILETVLPLRRRKRSRRQRLPVNFGHYPKLEYKRIVRSKR